METRNRMVDSGSVHQASYPVCSKAPSPYLQQPARAHQLDHVHIQIVFRFPRFESSTDTAGTEDAASSSSGHGANLSQLGEPVATPSKIDLSSLLKWMFPTRYLFSLALKVSKDISLFLLAFSLVVSALPFLGLALALSISILLVGATVAGSLIFFTCIIRSLCWLHMQLKQASTPAVESGVRGSAGIGYPLRALQFIGEVVATAAGLVDVWGTEILGEAVATAAGWIDATFFDTAFNQHFYDTDRAEERTKTRLALLEKFPRVKLSQLRTFSSANQDVQAPHRPSEGKMDLRGDHATADLLAAKKYALESNTCPICLEDIFEEEQVCQLSPVCVHIFHARCIDPWLAGGNSICPVCRSRLSPEEDSGPSRRELEYEPYSALDY